MCSRSNRQWRKCAILKKQGSVLGGEGYIGPLVSPPYPLFKGDEQFQSEAVQCEQRFLP